MKWIINNFGISFQSVMLDSCTAQREPIGRSAKQCTLFWNEIWMFWNWPAEQVSCLSLCLHMSRAGRQPTFHLKWSARPKTDLFITAPFLRPGRYRATLRARKFRCSGNFQHHPYYTSPWKGSGGSLTSAEIGEPAVRPPLLSGWKAPEPDSGSGSWACQSFGSIINGMLESLCHIYRSADILLYTTSFSAVHCTALLSDCPEDSK